MKTSILQQIMCFVVNQSTIRQSYAQMTGLRGLPGLGPDFFKIRVLGALFLGLLMASSIAIPVSAQGVFPDASFPLQNINFQNSVRTPNTFQEPGISAIFVRFGQDQSGNPDASLDMFLARFDRLEYYEQGADGLYQLGDNPLGLNADFVFFGRRYLVPCAADIDGDGDQDILVGLQEETAFVGPPYTLKILYLRNDEGSLVQDDANNPFASFSVTNVPENVTVSPGILDENGDGVPEGAILSYVDGQEMPQIEYYTFNTNTRVFEEANAQNPVAGEDFKGMINATFVDMDGDTDQDLVIGVVRDVAPSDSNFRYYENQNGAYVWQRGVKSPFARLLRDFTESNFKVVGRSPRFSFGDYTGDAKPDMLYGDFLPIASDGLEQGQVLYYSNTGKGNESSFGRIVGFAFVNNEASPSTAFEDLNGDGSLDLFIMGALGVSYSYLNDGQGGFATTTTQTFADSIASQITGGNPQVREFTNPQFVDLDNDGDKDFILGHFLEGTGQSFDYLLNDGNGTFIKVDDDRFTNIGSRVSGPSSKGTTHFGFFDADNDGILECVTGFFGDSLEFSRLNSQTNQYELDPSNNPLDRATLNLLSDPSFEVVNGTDPVFVDYDLDGDLDLFLKYAPFIRVNAALSARQRIAYYEFEAGSFTRRDDINPLRNFFHNNPNSIQTRLNFADTDGDGDLDMYTNLNSFYVEEFINESQPEISLFINQNESIASGATVIFDQNTTQDTSIIVRNEGFSNLRLINTNLNGSGFTLVSAPDTIGPLQQDTIVLSYTASASELGATLTFETNDMDEDSFTIFLTNADVAILTVQSSSSSIAADATLDYGNVIPGSAQDTTLSAVNTGTQDLNLSSVSISGDRFSLPNAVSATTLAPGQSLDFVVRFEPDANQTYTGTLTLTSDAANVTSFVINLSGVGNTVTSNEDLRSIQYFLGPVPGSRMNLRLENFRESQLMIELYDTRGNKVAEETLLLDGAASTERTLDFGNLAPGPYVLRMYSGEREAVRRIVVE